MLYFDKNEMYENKTVIIDDMGNNISYKELYDFSDDIKKRVPERSLVFSFCHNSAGAVMGYFSFLCNRIVPVLLDMNIEHELAKNLLTIYQPEYIYVPKEMKKEYEEYTCIFERYDYCLMKTNYSLVHNLYPELALLLTTSGSTGSPKFVRQSYKNIQANAESIAQYLELNDTERPITTLPMNYTYGLSIINSHLLVGATILLTDKALVEKGFWEFFRNEEATSFGGVPYTYEILKRLRFFNMKLPSLRTMTQAGGKLSPELHKEFAQYAKDNNKHFVVMYGQTEATARMAYLPYEKSLEKYGSMGIAIPNGRFTLIDENGEIISKPEVTGELVYEGPNVTLGYAENVDDLGKGDERHGRLVTGDMAKMDEDGYYYIVGRKKRFLKIYGNRVNLDEIERLLKRQFNDYSFACTGKDDSLYVFVTCEQEEEREKIKKYLSETTNLYHKAFIIKYIEEIPKNEAGKTLYSKLGGIS